MELHLPTGYAFVDHHKINPAEIMSLRQSVGWKSDTTERWQKCLEQNLYTVGIRHLDDGSLVGMACVAGNQRHAVLCDMAVHPSHQKKGLGLAISLHRLEAVRNMGISYVYAELAMTNPFRNLLLENGFQETGSSLFLDNGDIITS